MTAEENPQLVQPELAKAEATPAPTLPQPVSIPKRKPVPTAPAPINKEVSTTSDDSDGQTQQLGIDPEKAPEATAWEPQVNSNGNGARARFVLPALSLAVFDRVRLGPLDKYLPLEQRKRRYTIAGIFAGLLVALLALIIGLAAGLTASKK